MPDDLGLLSADLLLDSRESGPKRVQTLRRRRSPLASAKTQLELLDTVQMDSPGPKGGEFAARIADCGWKVFRPQSVEIFQINVGRLCNMTCRHCHVDAGPDRVEENMDRAMIDACLDALDRMQARTVDITGGAPELNPHFRYLVEGCVERGKHVIDRSNLSVLLLPRFRDLPQWLADRGVEVVASLPHPRKRNTDAQRGEGAHERSMQALRMLNDVGYGQGDPQRVLTLMHNPAGAFLPGSQPALEASYRRALDREGVRFDKLIALNNMPIARFLEWLVDSDTLQDYMDSLLRGFNPSTIARLMCRNTLSVAWNGSLYDCDFNQMLDLPILDEHGRPMTVRNFDPDALSGRTIVTRRHCFGCTAGAGSSCGGATAP
ncbi:MAG: arsenosugar biosynthesis radical SAM protein ArsS [Myxococcales bacterium]|jgi:radical SAM/Cys-rich protein